MRIIYQELTLVPSMTVAENVLFSLELREDYDAKNKEDVVNGLLQMVDLLDYKDAMPSDLSTGYKRAVAIARAPDGPAVVARDEWELAAEDGHICVSARRVRAQEFVRTPT